MRLSKTQQNIGYIITHLTLKNHGKEILNDNETKDLKLHQIGITRFSQSSTTSLIVKFDIEKSQIPDDEFDIPLDHV